MVERAAQITAAQRARGLDTEGSPWRRVRGIVPIVGPVILGSIAEVEERTMALEARGFTRPGRRTLLWSPSDSRAGALVRWGLLLGLVALIGRRGIGGVAGMTLTLRGVGYRYAGASRPALLDIDLDLPDGEVVGLAGASEAGKTTLCLVGSGLAPRTVGGRIRGTIAARRRGRRRWPMHRLAERIGIGFQNPATQLSQVAGTVFEEVAFGPMNLGARRVTRSSTGPGRRSTRLRIDELAERDPQRLSGGQQQLVAMAGLLAMRPAHLVLDEPTAQLDPAGTRLVADAIGRLAADGAEHPGRRAEDRPARRPWRARSSSSTDGRIALRGPAADVLADPRLDEAGRRATRGRSGSAAPPSAAGIDPAARAEDAA